MTNNLLLNSQNKSDLDETFTESSDGYCVNPNQLLIFSKPANKKLILIKLSQNLQMGIVSNQTKPNNNKPTLKLL